MGAISGTYGSDDLALVRKMIDTLVHRGPDGASTFSEKGVALGHRSLDILGKSTSRKPVTNEDGTVCIVLDGEIYNHQALREGLRGHMFSALTEAEVIVHLYEEDPDHFVDQLNGTFALAIWDSSRKRLTLARDHLGRKPLYYCQENGVLYFASEIKALLAAGVTKQVDEGMIDCYLGYQFCLGDRTLFKDIKRLMAGHMLRVSPEGVTMSRYWDIVTRPATTTAGAASDRLRGLLEGSCRDRMASDVPIGAFLSGGLDSSAVVALTRPLVNNEYHTISVGYPERSELELTKMVSEHVGTVHHELIVTPDMVAKQLEKVAWQNDEPIGDPCIVNNFFLSQEAHRFAKVVVAGGAGDELFAGHPSYARNLKFEDARHKMYGGFARSLMGMYPQRGNIFRNLHEKGMFTFEADSIEEMMLRSMRELSDREIKWLRGKVSSNSEALAVMPQGIRYRLDRMLYIDCKNRLPEMHLMNIDRSSATYSVEVRQPFLSKDIAEFAFTLPSALKLNAEEGNFIMRMAVTDLLPPEIVKRNETIPCPPVADWMRHEVGEMVLAELDSSEFLKAHFDNRRLERIGKEIRSKSGKASGKIWTVYALGLWNRAFFS